MIKILQQIKSACECESEIWKCRLKNRQGGCPVRSSRRFLVGSECWDKLLDLTVYKMKMPAKEPARWLSRQVSNLNSSDPESDVLPITPRDRFARKYILNMEKAQIVKKVTCHILQVWNLQPATCNMQPFLCLR